MSNDSKGDLRRLGSAFARGGDRYDRLRPGYPDEAVDWLLAGMPLVGAQVADIGAGTGKLTMALAARRLAPVAVDPSVDMLGELHRRLPAVQTQVGTGEATGLGDHSVHLVTFAQSWHWVEPAAGVAEIERVLRPAGTAAWLWNFLDARVAWVEALTNIWHGLGGNEATDAGRHAPALTSSFGPVEASTVDWVDPMGMADLAELVTTRSYYLSAAPKAQLEIRDRAAAFLTHQFPDVDRIEVPYRTHCFRAALAH